MNEPSGDRDYLLVALAGLLVVLVVLVDEGVGWWAVMPLVGGLLGLLVPGSVGTPFVLLSIVALLAMRAWFRGFLRGEANDPSPLTVAFFAAGLMAYVAGHSRLLAIKRHAIPPDSRRGRGPRGARAVGRWLLPADPTRRSALPSGEVVVLVASIPAFVFVAYLLWLRVALEPPPPLIEVSMGLWRVLLLAWAGMLALAVGYTLTSYLGRSLASREESLMYLQDQLWAATRAEQRRVNRWLVWGRLRAERREGGR